MKLSIFRYQGQQQKNNTSFDAPDVQSQNPRSIVLRYTLFGVLLGILFPLIAIVLQFFNSQLPLAFDNFIKIHQNNLPLWIIYTAPLFLGFFGYLAGKRQAKSLKITQELIAQLDENDHLTRRLETLNASLEQEVERRVVQLRTAAQVAQEANAYHELGELLSQAVQLIPNRFGFYHTGIFLNDAEGKYTILAASNSEGGQRMLRRGHALKIGEVGIVGYVAASGKARIALDVGKDPVFFDNPDLPETRSEIALPIKTSAKMSESESDISTMRTSQILGVLDIQSTKPGAFDEKDLIALQIIADSLAGAIENARLLSEAQDNLEEVKLLHRQYLRRAWGETQERQGKLAYNFQAIPSRPSPEGAQPGLVRSVSVPIRLREQVIGGLTIEAPLPEAPQAAAGSPNIEAGSEWTSEELALIEAVTNQAAQALENARLLEQVQSRAVQEELINRIVASIQGSLNLDTVMRTAVQEIGQALKARRVQIRLGVSGDREGGRPTQPITGEKIQGSLNRETDQ